MFSKAGSSTMHPICDLRGILVLFWLLMQPWVVDAAGNYQNCKILNTDNNYLMRWTIKNDTLFFQISFDTAATSSHSWGAWGIASNKINAMVSNNQCSDMMIASSSGSCPQVSPPNGNCVDSACTTCVDDLWVCAKPPLSEPSGDYLLVNSRDQQQNYFIESIVHAATDMTIQGYRLLNTGDSQDLEITPGIPNIVIWAFGEDYNGVYMKHLPNTRGQIYVDFGASSNCNATHHDMFGLHNQLTMTSPDGNFEASWTLNSVSYTVRIKAKTTATPWIGFGLNTAGSMIGADMTIAYFDNNYQLQIFDGYAKSKSLPSRDTALGGIDDINNYSGSLQKNGDEHVFSLEYTKNLDTQDTFDINLLLNEQVYLLYAIGDVISNNLVEHYDKGFVLINFKNGISTEVAGLTLLQRMHGALMIIAWMFFLAGGAIIGRHRESHFSSNWFKNHLFLQSSGSCLVIVAFFLIFYEQQWNVETDNPHTFIGIIVFSGMFIQIILGILSNRIAKIRHQVHIIHRWVGRSSILLALINIILGFVMIDNKEYLIIVTVLFVIWAVLTLTSYFLPIFSLKLISRRFQKIPYKNLKNEDDEMDMEEKENNQENNQENINENNNNQNNNENIQKNNQNNNGKLLMTKDGKISIGIFLISSIIAVCGLIVALAVSSTPKEVDLSELNLNGINMISLRFEDYLIPQKETNYMCISYKIIADEPRDVTRIVPIISNSRVLHHIVLYQTSSYIQRDSYVWDCTNMPNGDPVFLWAVGGEELVLPKDVGIRFGTDYIEYVVIQMHYDLSWAGNVHETSEVDSSGITLYFADEIQKYEMGITRFGVPYPQIQIPPGQPNFQMSNTCPSQATQRLPTNLNVFGLGLHMHFLGKKMSFAQYRNNQFLTYLGFINEYDFNNQNLIPSNATIMPGDSFVTTCVWDSTSRESITRGGEDTTKEMCYVFIFYYPKPNIDSTACET